VIVLSVLNFDSYASCGRESYSVGVSFEEILGTVGTDDGSQLNFFLRACCYALLREWTLQILSPHYLCISVSAFRKLSCRAFLSFRQIFVKQRSQGVLSLAGWTPPIQTDFHVFGLTQVPARPTSPAAYGTFTLYGRPFQSVLLGYCRPNCRSSNPSRTCPAGLG